MKLSYKESKKNNKNININPITNIPITNIPITNINTIPRPNPINILDIPCTDIRRARPCKSNPKCRYDGSDFKCKDKIINFVQPLPLNTNYNQTNMLNNIINGSKRASGRSKRASGRSKRARGSKKKTKSKHSSKKHNKSNNYNVRKTTKNVFSKLINSFGRIGNEAKKDSKLLKKATNKL